MSSLAAAYSSVRPEASGPALEAALRRLCEGAEAALPGVPVDRAGLCRAIAALPQAPSELGADAVIEVALAIACAGGDATALTLFETRYLGVAHAALAGMKVDADLRDEVLQELRRKLLVADGGPAKIIGYAGRGSLHGLLKVTATRTAITMLRRQGREVEGDDALVDATAEPDPELAFLKERYRGAFKEAFADAVAALEPHERNLLRLHFLRKVTLDALAQMYGVHRATVVRQLARVRDQLDRATHAGLRERLELDRAEVESIMDLIRSRFDASVERLLRTEER